MEDKVTKSKVTKSRDGTMALMIIIIVACMLMAVVFGGLFKYYHTAYYDTAKVVTIVLDDLHAVEEKFLMLRGIVPKYEKLKNECEQLRDHIEGIKDMDDLLKRDIFLYIDKTYQFIPKIVALEISEQITIQSKKSNISPELIVGIIQVESSFNPLAISKKNARGLMQVMPMWVKEFELKLISDLHDININIESGIKVLKIHIDEEDGNVSKGLYRYVGKSDSYAGKVYEAVGKFITFRATIDEKIDIETEDVKKEKKGKDGVK